MEAIRRICSSITTRDFWVRMPTIDRTPNASGKRPKTVGITALANRQERFRERNGLIAWKHRACGADPIKEAIKARLRHDDLAHNSTRNFGGLTKDQLKAAKASKASKGAQDRSEKDQLQRVERRAVEVDDRGTSTSDSEFLRQMGERESDVDETESGADDCGSEAFETEVDADDES